MKIIVIGAGVAGLSIGWRLAQGGARVTVLERAQPGRGATWASAGMIAATAEIEEGDTPQARLARHAASLWPHFAREIEEVSGIDPGYRVDGTLIVARSPAEAASLERRAKGSAALDFLMPSAASLLEPLLSDAVAGALFDPNEAQVDNRALAIALGIAFQRAGGVLKINEPVVRFEIETGRAAAARTPFALYRADAFVLAAGAWSSRIEGLPADASPAVIPVKGEMIALSPKGDAIPKHMVWGNEVYLVPRHDRLLVGATMTREGFDTRVTRRAAEWLHACATGLMPPLAEWDLADHWAGLRPGSPDDRPLIGPSSLDGLFVASGQFRNGILFAPAIAAMMRDVVLDGALPQPAFDPRRFAKEPPSTYL
ncbi:MAG: glycine oxidase ThiO [Alphaproteobacteria bacterium]|jgi:glycine oxidase